MIFLRLGLRREFAGFLFYKEDSLNVIYIYTYFFFLRFGVQNDTSVWVVVVVGDGFLFEGI